MITGIRFRLWKLNDQVNHELGTGTYTLQVNQFSPQFRLRSSPRHAIISRFAHSSKTGIDKQREIQVERVWVWVRAL
jgi:hypothetical protein